MKGVHIMNTLKDLKLDILFKNCETILFDNIIKATIIDVIPCQFTFENSDDLLVLKVDEDTTILRRLAEVRISS